MPISDVNRARFQGIGLEQVKRKLTVCNYAYIPIDVQTRAEARGGTSTQSKDLRNQ